MLKYLNSKNKANDQVRFKMPDSSVVRAPTSWADASQEARSVRDRIKKVTGDEPDETQVF